MPLQRHGASFLGYCYALIFKPALHTPSATMPNDSVSIGPNQRSLTRKLLRAALRHSNLPGSKKAADLLAFLERAEGRGNPFLAGIRQTRRAKRQG